MGFCGNERFAEVLDPSTAARPPVVLWLWYSQRSRVVVLQVWSDGMKALIPPKEILEGLGCQVLTDMEPYCGQVGVLSNVTPGGCKATFSDGRSWHYSLGWLFASTEQSSSTSAKVFLLLYLNLNLCPTYVIRSPPTHTTPLLPDPPPPPLVLRGNRASCFAQILTGVMELWGIPKRMIAFSMQKKKHSKTI